MLLIFTMMPFHPHPPTKGMAVGKTDHLKFFLTNRTSETQTEVQGLWRSRVPGENGI